MDDDVLNSYKTVRVWSEEETKLLFNLYEHYFPEIGPLQRFKNKKEMWSTISTEFPDKSAKQCEERYKTVLRRKKHANDNHVSDAKKKKCMYVEDFEICIMDDSIEPKKEKDEKVITGQPAQKNLTVQETLLQIAAKKEESKERRHKEKMDAIGRMLSLLQKVLDDKNK